MQAPLAMGLFWLLARSYHVFPRLEPSAQKSTTMACTMLDKEQLEVLGHAKTRSQAHDRMVKCLVLGSGRREGYAPLFDRDMMKDENRAKKLTMNQLRVDKIDLFLYDATDLYHTDSSRDWMTSFEHIDVILLIADLSSFDEVDTESGNRLNAAFAMFRDVLSLPIFSKKNILLLFDKKDVFVEKISTHGSYISDQAPFSEYCGPSRDPVAGLMYFIEKFKDYTFGEDEDSSELFVHVTCASDQNTNEFLVHSVRTIITTINLRTSGFFGQSTSEDSVVTLTVSNDLDFKVPLRVEDLKWTETKGMFPKLLKDKGVTMEEWEFTFEAVESQFLRDFRTAESWCHSGRWFSWRTPLVHALLSSHDSWTAILEEHQNTYKNYGITIQLCVRSCEPASFWGLARCFRISNDDVPCGLLFLC